MKTKLYIAYGSNMDEKQMAHRCPNAKLIGASEVKDHELLFKGSQTGSYATIEPKKGKNVPVLVWKITAKDEQNLDLYEGYPTFYYKKNLPVTVDGEALTAMVYIMDEKRILGMPSNHYLDILDRAYHKFGFNYDILIEAYIKSRKAVCGNGRRKTRQA